MPEIAVGGEVSALAAPVDSSVQATKLSSDSSTQAVVVTDGKQVQAGGGLSNFRKVCEFHEAFGVKHTEEPQMNIFVEDPKTMKLRLDLIREEFKELEQAASEKNMTEVDLPLSLRSPSRNSRIDLLT